MQVWRTPHPFKGSVARGSGTFLGGNTIKTKHNLKDIRNDDQDNLINNFVDNFHMYFKQQNKIPNGTPLSKSCDNFWVSFLGCKYRKYIQKLPKAKL